MASSGGDARYFTSASKGELFELKKALQSTKEKERREAVKRVIAAMTVGKDVSSLFSQVVNIMQTDSLELKKLSYLYLINYAKSSPQLALLAVNTFVKDAADPNPLVRALAVRTIGCIRVDRVTEYLVDPLRRALKDEDAFVRKTAAVCVAKLYDIDPELVKEQGFLDSLMNLLSDSVPMVIANAIAALSEISEASTTPVLELNPSLVNKLLTALGECTEWGQVFILDSLALYEPADDRERQSMCERIVPRLQHVNAAVVLSAIKALMINLDKLQDAEFKAMLYKKLAPPLVTLLSSEPEVQYVALRNINLIVQKKPDILTNHLKVFFVKYTDPVYTKLEKLDVIVRLTNSDNVQQVLAELKEYAAEVDIEFVRKSVRAIGRVAIKVESAASASVDTLLDLIQTKVNYVVQEAIVVIKDIFRKYPNKYEATISVLCDNLDSLDEPSAKAAMVWIIGEYSARIDNADELLEAFMENFLEENSEVQLQLLSAVVKLFLKRPTGTQELVQRVLGLATQESDSPDLRDRGFIYWRLLLTDPAAAKAVVLCEKPLLADETDVLEPSLLDELLCHMASLASVFHKPPANFVEGRVPGRRAAPQALFEVEEADLLGGALGGDAATAASAAAPVDLLGGLSMDDGPKPYVAEKKQWLDSAAGKGLELLGTFAQRDGQIRMEMTFKNTSTEALADFAIQLNTSSFGLWPDAPLNVPTLAPGQAFEAVLPLNTVGAVRRTDPLSLLQVAVKTSVDVCYFSTNVPFHVLLTADGQLPRREYLELWSTLDDGEEFTSQLELNGPADVQAVLDRLQANNVFLVAKRRVEEKTLAYLSTKFVNNVTVLLELAIEAGSSSAKLSARSQIPEVLPALCESVSAILMASASEV